MRASAVGSDSVSFDDQGMEGMEKEEQPANKAATRRHVNESFSFIKTEGIAESQIIYSVAVHSQEAYNACDSCIWGIIAMYFSVYSLLLL